MSDLAHLEAVTARDSTRAVLARDLRRRITDPVCAQPDVGWLQLETDYAFSPSQQDGAEILQRT